MADKPSRALVVYGDGLASRVSSSHAHLHSFAARACCGFLSLRSAPPNESESDRAIRELAQLLDAYDFYVSKDKSHAKADDDANIKESSIPTIAMRFMGVRAALCTSCPEVGSFARTLGLTVLQVHDLVKADSHSEPLYDVQYGFAKNLCSLLGFSGESVEDKYDFDLVILHIGASVKSTDKKEKMLVIEDIDWLNSLVGGILQTAQPCSTVASRLHFSIVLSYGTVPEGDEEHSLTSEITNSDLSLLRPQQSFAVRGENTLSNIRHHHPMLVAQWQEAVTRKDMATAFYFEEFKEHGGNLAILADRFLHEVAFKLWKAPKYGA